MSQGIEDEIKKAAATAKDLLGQLGPLVWGLHECHASAAARAILLSVDPEEYVAIGVPDPCDKIRKRVVEDLECVRRGVSFEEAPRLFRSEGLRETVNRSIVVYAVAVLERFLDEAGKPVWKPLRWDQEQCWPPDTLDRITLLDELEGVSPKLRSLDHYVGAGWLVVVRNAIIHNDGEASLRIRNDAKDHRLSPRWSLHQGTLVWDDSARQQLKGQDWNDRPFSIAIDHFILPRLRDAQAFVMEAKDVLLGALGERR